MGESVAGLVVGARRGQGASQVVHRLMVHAMRRGASPAEMMAKYRVSYVAAKRAQAQVLKRG